MGKVAIISVLTLLFVLGIVGYSLNDRMNDAVKNYAGYYEDDVARNIASSAVEIYTLELRENAALRGTFTIPSLMGGSATVYIVDKVAGDNDTLLMTSTGTYEAASDTIKNMLYTPPQQLPPILGGVGMATGTSAAVQISGSATLSGADMNINGTAAVPADSVPGIAINLTNPTNNDTVTVTTNISNHASISPGIQRVASLPDYTTFAGEMMSLGQVYTSSAFSSNSAPIGTDAQPQITYVTGSPNISGQLTGSGILIVNGNLSVSGQFTFHGLIIVYGSSTVTLKASGQLTVYGSVVIAGNNTSYQLPGTTLIQYSKQALNLAASLVIGKYVIADWWE